MERSPEKNNAMVLLLDFYGELLTERQRQIAELYYDDDLSLSEISQNTGITRQGVRESLLKSVALLETYEEKLHMRARFAKTTACLQALCNVIQKMEPYPDDSLRDLLLCAQQLCT